MAAYPKIDGPMPRGTLPGRSSLIGKHGRSSCGSRVSFGHYGELEEVIGTGFLEGEAKHETAGIRFRERPEDDTGPDDGPGSFQADPEVTVVGRQAIDEQAQPGLADVVDTGLVMIEIGGKRACFRDSHCLGAYPT